MPEYRDRRAGEPGRRPEPVARDGSPRRELAYWLRGAVEDHGGPTLDRILRGLPDEVRLSRSALGKALRGDTFGDLPLVLGVLRAVGADEAELEAWTGHDHHARHDVRAPDLPDGRVVPRPPLKQEAPDSTTYRIDVLVADAGASNALLQYQIDKGGPDGPNAGLAAPPAGATTISMRLYTRV